MEKILNYINGKLIEPSSGNLLNNVNPAIGKVYSLVADSDSKDLEQAVSAAKAAYPSWSNLAVEERADWVFKLSQEINNNIKKLALTECIDTGKPISILENIEIPRSVQNFKYFSRAIVDFHDKCYPTDKIALNYVLRSPVGIVSCISPWNLPLYLLTWKLAPALVTGNCVIAKPSEVTPMTAFLLSKICMKINFPVGVLNIIHGQGSRIGNEICKHKDIQAISFTGGTVTGKSILNTTSHLIKKTSLELGGKNATIVFADCDFEKALEGVVKAAFYNQGQVCLAGSRIYIEKSIYNDFKTALIKKTKELNLDDPLNYKTQIGSVISEQHFNKIMDYLSQAKQEHGELLCGGNAKKIKGRCKDGYFIEPTLFSGLSHNSVINQEEIFGPFATVNEFKKTNEVIELANNTEYGLSASIWTRDLETAYYVAHNLNVGTVWINTWLLRDLRVPFGGIKKSGLGSEGGFNSMKFFTNEKNICVKL